MGFRVYDFRRDKDSFAVTPEIRAKFMHMESGQIAESHGHELGVSVFLVLQGKIEFVIEGDTQELGEGELCIALANQKHIMRCTQGPAICYLSVTPHVQPTHTMHGKDGAKILQRYLGESVAVPFGTALRAHLTASEELARLTAKSADVQRESGATLAKAVEAGDVQSAAAARRAMWDALFASSRAIFRHFQKWNDLVDAIPGKLNWSEGMTPAEKSAP